MTEIPLQPNQRHFSTPETNAALGDALNDLRGALARGGLTPDERTAIRAKLAAIRGGQRTFAPEASN